jgi:hypothetical protein
VAPVEAPADEEPHGTARDRIHRRAGENDRADMGIGDSGTRGDLRPAGVTGKHDPTEILGAQPFGHGGGEPGYVELVGRLAAAGEAGQLHQMRARPAAQTAQSRHQIVSDRHSLHENDFGDTRPGEPTARLRIRPSGPSWNETSTSDGARGGCHPAQRDDPMSAVYPPAAGTTVVMSPVMSTTFRWQPTPRPAEPGSGGNPARGMFAQALISLCW